MLSLGLLLSFLGVGNVAVPEVYGWRPYLAGMSVFGGAGTVVARKTWSERQAAARGLLAELILAEGAKNVTSEQVSLLEEEMGVPPSYFALQKADVYSAFLADLLTEPELRVGELAELQQLRRALQLAWPLVGASHLQRGLALTRGQAPAQLEAARPDDWARLRKLLFLSDCLLAEAPKRPKGTAAAAGGGGSGGSAVVRALRKVEARTDATTLLGRQARRALAALDAERRPPPGSAAAGRGAAGRAAKAAAAMLVPPPTIDEIFEALSLSPAQGKALVRETALPLYARAVQSALGRLGNNTAVQLERARKALGLDMSETAAAHREAYAAIVAKLVGSGKLDADDREMLGIIADTLALRAGETGPILEEATAPLYAETLSAALDKCAAEPEARPLQLWGPVARRQAELSIPPAAADKAMAAALGARTRPHIEALSAALDAGDDAGALAAARALVAVGSSAARFVHAMQSSRVETEADVAGLCRAFMHGGAVEPGAEELVSRMQAALQRLAAKLAAAEPSALSPTEVAQLSELLGLPADAKEAARAQEGVRELRAALEHAVSTRDFADFEAARALERRLELPAPLSAKARLDAFYEAAMAAAEAEVLDEAALEALAELVAALDLSRAQLQRLNAETAACEQLAKRVRTDVLASGERLALPRIDRLRDVLIGRF